MMFYVIFIEYVLYNFSVMFSCETDQVKRVIQCFYSDTATDLKAVSHKIKQTVNIKYLKYIIQTFSH